MSDIMAKTVWAYVLPTAWSLVNVIISMVTVSVRLGTRAQTVNKVTIQNVNTCIYIHCVVAGE